MDLGSLVGGSIGGFADGIAGLAMSNSANAKSKRAAALQYIMNYTLANQLMDKQNEYNRPINQMARLREAGLNPNLVYGDGGATMASASGSASVGQADITPSSGTFNVLGKMQALQSMKQSEANIAETNARTNAIDDNIKLKEDELNLRREDLKLQRMAIMASLGLKGAQQRKVEEETNYLNQKSPVSLTSDPVGYIVDIGTRVGNAYNQFYDYVRDIVAPKIIKKRK